MVRDFGVGCIIDAYIQLCILFKEKKSIITIIF